MDEEREYELSQWEGDVTGQEISRWEGEGYQQASPLEEDVQGHLHILQWEEDQRDTELSQVGDNNVQELPQGEKDVGNQKLSQGEEGGSSQGLSQWAEGIRDQIWDKTLHPEKDEEAQTGAQVGPSSRSRVGTQVLGDAARELPSASPAASSALDTELAAAAALTAAAEKEELSKPLAPEVEKAPACLLLRQEIPTAETDRSVFATQSPQVSSQALLDLAQPMSPETMSQALLEMQESGQQPEEERELEQIVAAEEEAAAPGEMEFFLIYFPASSPSCSQAQLDLAQHGSCESVSLALLELQESGQEPEEENELEQNKAADLEAAVPGERALVPISTPASSPSCSQAQLDLGQQESYESVSQAFPEMQEYGLEQEEERDLEEIKAAAVEEAAPGERALVPISPPASSPSSSLAHMDMAQEKSCESVSQAFPETQESGQQQEEERELEQSVAAEVEAAAPGERALVLISAPASSPSCSQAQLDLDQEKSCESVSPAFSEMQESGQQAEEERELEQIVAAEVEAAAPGERALVPISTPASSPSCSLAELDLAQQESCESVSQTFPETKESGQQQEEERELEQSVAAEVEAAAPRERESVPNSAPHSPSCPPSPLDILLQLQALSEQLEEAETGLLWAQQGSEEGLLLWELKRSLCKYEEVTEVLQGDAASYEDVSQGEASSEQELSEAEASSNRELSDSQDECKEQELSLGEARRYEPFSEWQEGLETGLSHKEVIRSPALSDWEEYSKQERSHQEVGSYQEVSDWEESIRHELSQEEDSIGQQVPKGNGNRPSVQSSWQDDSDKELEQDNWQSVTVHSIEVKPLAPEEDEWDEVSVLELFEEPRLPTLGGSAGDGFPVPPPREAWVERPAFEPCPQAPLRARPPRVEAQSLIQQLGPRKKPPSRFRRALRALRSLFCCPCMSPQPED